MRQSRCALILLLALLSLHGPSADEGPRLGIVVEVQPEALIVEFDDTPDDGAAVGPQRIPLTGQSSQTSWQPGMPVRIWPGATSRAGLRIQPIGAASGLDRTGVRRRLSKGSQRGGRGASGSGHGGRGGR